MATYIEFHPDQVQSYITRWSDLKGRRGASTMSRLAASTDAIEPLLQSLSFDPEPVVNTDGPDVDGAVSIMFRDGESPAPSAAKPVVDAVLEHLTRRVPGLRFHAAVVQVDRGHTPEVYFETYRDLIEPQILGGGSQVALPAPAEIPTARRCSRTGTDLSIGTRTISDNENWHEVGFDAFNRIETADWRNSRSGRVSALLAEDKLASAVGFNDPQAAEVKDFAHLAHLAPDSNKRNHLATIYIDGNRIGEHLHAVQGTTLVEMSEALKRATKIGLKVATDAVLTDCIDPASATYLPVLPHIVGGDDVLVTMPACAGWTFVRKYLVQFAATLENTPGRNGGAISASAGIVFHHVKFPFTRAANLAEQVLANAKKRSGAAVAFAETTQQTTAPVPHLVWDLDKLSDHADLIEATRRLPQNLLTTCKVNVDEFIQAKAAGDMGRAELADLAWYTASRAVLTLEKSAANNAAVELELAERVRRAACSRTLHREFCFLSKLIDTTRWY